MNLTAPPPDAWIAGTPPQGESSDRYTNNPSGGYNLNFYRFLRTEPEHVHIIYDDDRITGLLEARFLKRGIPHTIWLRREDGWIATAPIHELEDEELW